MRPSRTTRRNGRQPPLHLLILLLFLSSQQRQVLALKRSRKNGGSAWGHARAHVIANDGSTTTVHAAHRTRPLIHVLEQGMDDESTSQQRRLYRRSQAQPLHSHDRKNLKRPRSLKDEEDFFHETLFWERLLQGDKGDKGDDKGTKDAMSMPGMMPPGDKDGMPGDKDGMPGDKDGEPADKDGEPADKDGEPADKDGEPSDKDGEPSDKDGEPSDKDGEPAEGIIGGGDDKDGMASSKDGEGGDGDLEPSSKDGEAGGGAGGEESSKDGEEGGGNGEPSSTSKDGDGLEQDSRTPAPTVSGAILPPGIYLGDPETAAPTIPTFDLIVQEKCGISSAQRSTELLFTTSSISDISKLINPATPQFAARYWLDTEDGLLLCADDEAAVLQRYIAAVVYFSLGGSNWTQCQADLDVFPAQDECVNATRWLDESSECTWFGMACNTNGSVQEVNLTSNNLAGMLPTELFQWRELEGLSMDHNKNIGGQLPRDILFLDNLVYINLDDNSLTGSLPEAIYTMASLQAIDLNDNQLTGTLDDQIGNLDQLMVLQLENNLMGGPLPEFGLRRLKELLVLTLQGNNFTGSFADICWQMSDRREENIGYLQFFMSDCLNGEPVDCPCCSQCF